MLKTLHFFPTLSGLTTRTFTDQFNCNPTSFQLSLGSKRCRQHRKSSLVSCCHSNSGIGTNSSLPNNDFFEASLLLPETISHYVMRKQGFRELSGQSSSSGWLRFSPKESGPKSDVGLILQAFSTQFRSPTIFLKINRNGEYLLPITVGDFAIEKLIDSLRRDKSEHCPDQFQFARNLMEELGQEVKMVRITERVVHTYHARLYFSKPGSNDIVSVDARPSDAINVALRCKAPIYVSRQIVLTDAIDVGYVMGKLQGTKPTYDVVLDSAADGPDVLAEELDLVNNMNLAIRQESHVERQTDEVSHVKVRSISQTEGIQGEFCLSNTDLSFSFPSL